MRICPQGVLDISHVNPQSTSIRSTFSGTIPKQTLTSKLQAKMQKKTIRRRVIRSGLVGFNVALLAAVISFVALQPRASQPKTLASATASNSSSVASPLDQLSSANIALTVARMTNLPETTPITNQADSEDVALSQASTEDSNVSTKPQVVASAFKSAKDIKTYVTVAGDTISSIADKFGVTSDSIRWSNNLSGDAVSPGKKLLIPPVNGIVYTVASGENATTIAVKFNADPNKVIAFNDAEITGLKPGQLILVPDGSKAAAVVHSASSGSRSLFGMSATYGGYNGYDYGYCTYWVAKLRAAAGNPVPTNLGNASTWATRAAAMGLPVGSTPRVGAAVVTKTSGAGHVAYVTAVNGDGTITISEMNHIGWNKVDTRSIPAASNFRYIY
jgi:surface antigen